MAAARLVINISHRGTPFLDTGTHESEPHKSECRGSGDGTEQYVHHPHSEQQTRDHQRQASGGHPSPPPSSGPRAPLTVLQAPPSNPGYASRRGPDDDRICSRISPWEGVTGDDKAKTRELPSRGLKIVAG
jgi:hypothetical protein